MRRRGGCAAAALLVVLLAGCSGVRVATQTSPASGRAPATATRGGLFAGRLLVYGFHGFDAGEVDAVRRAVRGPVAAVYSAEVAVASGRAGYPVVPVEAITADPAEYAAAAGDPSLATTMARGAVLARSESRLRRVTAGGTLRLADGRPIRVSAVVEDHVLGGKEMSLPRSVLHPRKGVAATYLLVADGGDATRTTAAVRGALPDRSVRVRSRTANGYLGNDDTVLTQLQVKLRFGEFALRRLSSGTFLPDPAWSDRYLVEHRHVPQLGTVTCNREVMRALTAAMVEVTARGLDRTVHTADFIAQGGCWNPTVVPLSGGSVSRHAWGIAVDINVDTNQLGDRPRQDSRLLDIMRRHGFVWGGQFLRPDGMHFEYAGPGGLSPTPPGSATR